MEANNTNSTSMIRFDPKTEIYGGSCNVALLNKFIYEGVFEVVDIDGYVCYRS
jgi:hypothetical protein